MKNEEFLNTPLEGARFGTWWVSRVFRLGARTVFRICFRPKVSGLENLPKENGYIIAGNHVSYIDPIFFWYLLKIKIRYMAKGELFENSFLKWLGVRVFAFPVQRGTADRAAIRYATNSLKRGENVGIFPEGTRVRDGVEANIHSGAAFIAALTKSPIVPVAIVNAEKITRKGSKRIYFPKIYIHVGEPVYLEDFADVEKSKRQDAMIAEVMKRVYALRDIGEK